MVEIDDGERLRALVRLHASERKPRTLMEALGFLHLENPHSAYLAWIVDPASGTEAAPLVRALLRHARVHEELGSPVSVKCEVAEGGERADIVLAWTAFKLVIENKVWSSEGHQQCVRYLSTFEITGPEVGRLVYLSLRGDWPPSVKKGDLRVVSMSYADLHAILRECEVQVQDPRTKILMREYADALAQLTQLIRTSVTEKPTISPCTIEFCKAQPSLTKIDEVARRESQGFVQWLVNPRLRDAVSETLGSDMRADEYASHAWLFRRERWRERGLAYGLGYSIEAPLGRRVLPDYSHLLGVRVQPIEGRGGHEHADLTAQLGTWLGEHWPGPIQLGGRSFLEDPSHNREGNDWWTCFTSMKLQHDQDWNGWAKGVTEAMAELARQLSPILDNFAARRSHA